MPTATLQETFISDDGIRFEIYACRKLTREEIEREVALFRISMGKRNLAGKTHRIVSVIGKPGRNAEQGS